MATTRRPRTISFDVPSRRTQTDSIEYSSSVTGGFHQVLDFAPPTLQRRPSSLILTPKAGGKLQWEFPPGSDTATTAVNLTSIECNACSPPATPVRDTERLNCPRWDANPSPLMVPKMERRLSLSATEVTKTPLISIMTFSDTEEDFTSTEMPNKPELHSYRHLSQSYGTLPKRKSVIFPIDYSAPENIIALSKALELSPIKLVGREEDTTPVLSTELGSELRLRIPRARRLEPSWNLLYSIDQHGASILTMYEKLRDQQGPIILALKDDEDKTFGAYLSEPFQPHPGFYGNGECFLWKTLNSNLAEPDIKVYTRSGENEYYILSDLEFIAIGSSDGKYGLWLDSQFEKGVTSRCSTFDNDPLTSQKFVCIELEIWGISK